LPGLGRRSNKQFSKGFPPGKTFENTQVWPHLHCLPVSGTTKMSWLTFSFVDDKTFMRELSRKIEKCHGRLDCCKQYSPAQGVDSTPYNRISGTHDCIIITLGILSNKRKYTDNYFVRM